MAIEIRELKITGYINKESKKQSQSSYSSLNMADLQSLTKKIKAECVEEVLDILERKNRR